MSEFLSTLGPFSGIRAIIAFVLVFLVPGFAWTLVFFRRINVLERLALSFGLSIAMVTLSIIAANKLMGVRISGLNSVIIILVITVIPLLIYGFRMLVAGKPGRGDVT